MKNELHFTSSFLQLPLSNSQSKQLSSSITHIVGYTTKDVDQGKFYILGAGFESVSGGAKLNDLVSGVTGVDFGDGVEFQNTAAQIQVPAAVGYAKYYYLNDAWFDNGTEDGDVKPGWADADGNLVDDELLAGVAFWFKSVPGAATPTVAGAVPAEAAKTVDCPQVFALRAGAFPVDMPLNGAKMTSTDIIGVDFGDGVVFQDTAAQIQVPAAVGYSKYFYLNDAWFDNGTEEGDVKPGWADADGNLVEDSIPAMQGFWTKGTPGAFTLKFTM